MYIEYSILIDYVGHFMAKLHYTVWDFFYIYFSCPLLTIFRRSRIRSFCDPEFNLYGRN